MSKVYVLSTDGKIKTLKDLNEIQPSNLLKDILPLDLSTGDLETDSNTKIISDKFSNLKFSKSKLYSKEEFKYSEYKKNLIGDSKRLAHPAFGENAADRSYAYYKPYNSVFDLNLNDLQGQNKNLQIFADEMQLNFIGAPLSFIEATKPGEIIEEIDDVFLSFTDIFLAAIIPVTQIGLLQVLLQGVLSNEADPLGILPRIDPSFVKRDRLGKYIGYFKIDADHNSAFSFFSILNPIIDAAVSFLNLMERLTGFPKFKITGIFDGILQILKNVLNFLLGYVYYLLPGFKLNPIADLEFDLDKILKLVVNIIADVLGNITRISSSRHNLNLLNRKIIMNRYFQEEIMTKAKTTTTDENNTTYSYFGQNLIKYSQFFYKFVSERVIVGDNLASILLKKDQNKSAFSIQKIREIPRDYSIFGKNDAIPVPFGSVLGQKDKSTADSKKEIKALDKSIYSFGTVIRKTHESANKIFDYHNRLIEQNEKLLGYYIPTDSKEGDTKYKRFKRLDKKFVKEVEEIINSDYMPFSIQDLRTNEIFKFHAFLENFGDSFTVNWDDTGAGFGRMDPIKIYKGTTRSITVDFWLVAMGKEDFDTVWWMINRLIALIYPQWSKPITAHISNQQAAGLDGRGIKFSQPFTQIPTASPVIRLRLGDLFTSNYSKNTLAKIFGFEDDLNVIGNNLKDQDFIVSDLKTKILGILQTELGKSNSKKVNEAFQPKIDNILNDKFACKIIDKDELEDVIYDKFWRDAKKEIYNNGDNQIDTGEVTLPALNVTKTIAENEKLFQGLLFVNDQENVNNKFYNIDFKNPVNKIQPVGSDAQKYSSFIRIIWIVLDVIKDEEEKKLILPFQMIFTLPQTEETLNMHAYDGFNTAVINEIFNLKDGQSFAIRNMENFLQSTVKEGDNLIVNNPVVKAFESTMGEGLAGTIQNFSISYDQSIPWDIDDGKRAPIGAKISLGISVIHDILPGLDHNGVMRAPTYRVGNTNRNLFGTSVHDESIKILPGESNEVKNK